MTDKPDIRVAQPADLIATLHEVGAMFVKAVIDAAASNQTPEPFDDFAALVERGRAAALSLFNDMRNMPPAFLLMSQSGLTVPVLLDALPESRLHQGFIASAMAALVHTAPIDAYCFWAEVWVAHGADDRPPSQRPDRIEAVWLRTATRLHSEFCLFAIVRSKTNRRRVVDLTPMQGPPSGSIGEAHNPLMHNLYAVALAAKEGKPVPPDEFPTDVAKRRNMS